jgi:hypothetical protein
MTTKPFSGLAGWMLGGALLVLGSCAPLRSRPPRIELSIAVHTLGPIPTCDLSWLTPTTFVLNVQAWSTCPTEANLDLRFEGEPRTSGALRPDGAKVGVALSDSPRPLGAFKIEVPKPAVTKPPPRKIGLTMTARCLSGDPVSGFTECTIPGAGS